MIMRRTILIDTLAAAPAPGRLVMDENMYGGRNTYSYDTAGNLIHERFHAADDDADLPDRHVEHNYDALNRPPPNRNAGTAMCDTAAAGCHRAAGTRGRPEFVRLVLQKVRVTRTSGCSVIACRNESADARRCVRLFLPNSSNLFRKSDFPPSIRLDSREPAQLSTARSMDLTLRGWSLR